MLIACPSCQRQLNVPDNAAGKQVRCPAPDCGTIFTVSQPAPVVQAAPLKPVPVAAAPRLQPKVGGAPFDFGGGGVVGPEADFGFTESTDGGLKGIGLRTRVHRASSWLNTAAGSMVLFTLASIGLQIARFVMFRTQELAWISLVVAGCMPFILLPFPILIVVGARMLSRTRRRGMAMTAAGVSFVIGILSVLALLGWTIYLVLALVGGAATAPDGKFKLVDSCGNLVLLTMVAFFSIFAGIVALRTLMNAEIKKMFT
jgi:hypothetical protein